MAFKSPMQVVDINVFIDGIGFLGRATEAKLPEVELLKESIKSGGFERDFSTGVFKKLEYEISIKEVNSYIFERYSNMLATGEDVQMVIKGSTLQDNEKKSIVATIKADPNIALSSLKQGEITSTLKGSASFYKLEIDNKEVVSMDTKNMIAKINGIDYLETLRKHIM